MRQLAPIGAAHEDDICAGLDADEADATPRHARAASRQPGAHHRRPPWLPATSMIPTAGTVSIVGVPGSAGSYAAGQEQAPASLRSARLIPALREAGLKVNDEGDLPLQVWSPDRVNPRAQNIDEVTECVAELIERLVPLFGPLSSEADSMRSRVCTTTSSPSSPSTCKQPGSPRRAREARGARLSLGRHHRPVRRRACFRSQPFVNGRPGEIDDRFQASWPTRWEWRGWRRAGL